MQFCFFFCFAFFPPLFREGESETASELMASRNRLVPFVTQEKRVVIGTIKKNGECLFILLLFDVKGDADQRVLSLFIITTGIIIFCPALFSGKLLINAGFCASGDHSVRCSVFLSPFFPLFSFILFFDS